MAGKKKCGKFHRNLNNSQRSLCIAQHTLVVTYSHFGGRAKLISEFSLKKISPGGKSRIMQKPNEKCQNKNDKETYTRKQKGAISGCSRSHKAPENCRGRTPLLSDCGGGEGSCLPLQGWLLSGECQSSGGLLDSV